jgi:hypothetical protein
MKESALLEGDNAALMSGTDQAMAIEILSRVDDALGEEAVN